MATRAKPLLEALSQAAGGESSEEDWIIAVVELLAVVALATKQGPSGKVSWSSRHGQPERESVAHQTKPQ
eukprot:1114722-Pyramimonas_sp.AAC.1